MLKVVKLRLLTIIRKYFNFTQTEATFNADQLNSNELADQRSCTRKCFRCAFIWKWGRKNTYKNKHTPKQWDQSCIQLNKNGKTLYSEGFFFGFRSYPKQAKKHSYHFMIMWHFYFQIKGNSKHLIHYVPTVPGYQAHSGFLCRSKLLFPTRISRSWSGGKPQQPRVVILTTRTVCGANKSTRHHGDISFCVSEHFCSSGFSLPNLPSLAKPAGPARVEDDWFTGFRYATFVPNNQTKK